MAATVSVKDCDRDDDSGVDHVMIMMMTTTMTTTTTMEELVIKEV